MEALFATPRRGLNISECQFYHTMDLPGHGLVTADPGAGGWDLRGKEDDLLGHVDFTGKRLLEIGPASGFLTFAAEKRGATVVCVEVTEDYVYDIVPFPGLRERWAPAFRSAWRPCTNAYWFAHECFHSKAQVHYGNGYAIPQELGIFNVALVANMLLHNRDPLKILEGCAALATDEIIVVESYHPDLEESGRPILEFLPNPTPEVGQEHWNLWWRFSTHFFENTLAVLGFPRSRKNIYQARVGVCDWWLFTLVASRT
jgi:hypothetical protein